jgi:hypothetical protein
LFGITMCKQRTKRSIYPHGALRGADSKAKSREHFCTDLQNASIYFLKCPFWYSGQLNQEQEKRQTPYEWRRAYCFLLVS